LTAAAPFDDAAAESSRVKDRLMSRKGRIGCAGELLVEFVCESKNGRHRRADVYRGPFPSGAPGIFIDQAAQMGSNCIFVGAVGDDAFGSVIVDRLVEHGVHGDLIARVPQTPTGSAFVSYNDDGSRDFVYNIALSAAPLFDVGPQTIAALAEFKLDIMHVSGSALGDRAMCEKIMTLCRALQPKGVKISFDPNVRKELASDESYFTAVHELTGLASIFLPSEEDAEILFPGRSLQSYGEELCAKGLDYVVLKRGDKGAEGLSRIGERVDVRAHAVEVRDPTGAGDCFCATFVSLIANGAFSFRQAIERANAAGALAVTRVGPMEGNSDLAAIEDLLAKAR
jgi:sugar/nucleoside kinase (ribokinase family)